MAEPVTLVVGGYLFGLVSDVAGNMIAGRADARLQTFLDRRVNQDIQDALRKAWKAACVELFQRYREAPGYGSLRRDERELVKARGDLFVAPATIEVLFPSSPDTAALTADDVNRLFGVEHDEVNQALLSSLTRLGLLDDLPGGLERQIRDALLNGLLFHFVEVGIKRDSKTRDALFFEQLIRILRGTAATEDELRAIRTKLEQLDGYQQWQRVMLTDIAAGVGELLDRVKPSPTTALHSIPTPPSDFTGRAEEIAQIEQVLRQANGTAQTICGVRGLGGIGKSVLAQRAAQELSSSFPDGQIFLALRGARAEAAMVPEEALREVLRAFGKETDPNLMLDQLRSDYLSTLHGKRVLILADDAKDEAQVKPLLPLQGSALLITSRRLVRLPGMPPPLELGKLPETEAIEFVTSICERIGAQAKRLVMLCGCLPQALRISATFLAKSSRPIESYLEELENERTRLRVLRKGNPEADIEASFNLSYTALSANAQTLLRQLSVFATSFNRVAVGHVAMLPDMADDAFMLDDLLDELRGFSLLDYDDQTERYSLHDLVRVFALERLREEDEEEVRLRYAAYFLRVVTDAEILFRGGSGGTLLGLSIFDNERAHIDAAWTWVRQQPPTEISDLLLIAYTQAMAHMGDLRYDKRRERIPQIEAALEVARRQGDTLSEGRFLGNLGSAYMALGNARRAITYYEQELIIVRGIGTSQNEGDTLTNLGSAYITLGNARRAITYYEQALRMHQKVNNRQAEGATLGNLGNVYWTLNDVPRAIDYYKQQLVIGREIGDRRWEGLSLGNIGVAYATLDDVPHAIHFYRQALEIHRELGDQQGESIVLGNLGIAYFKLGDADRAIEHHKNALFISRTIGNQHSEGIQLANLSSAYTMQGDLDQGLSYAEQAYVILQDIESPDAEKVQAWIEGRRQQKQQREHGSKD